MTDLCPSIFHSDKFALLGLKMEMSAAEDKTAVMWEQLKSKITHPRYFLMENHYCVQIYPDDYFSAFDPERKFVKWVALPASRVPRVPGLEIFEVMDKLMFARFDLYGSDNKEEEIYSHTMNEWLPYSQFAYDNRPHLKIEYFSPDPYSRAKGQLWIPIKIRR